MLSNHFSCAMISRAANALIRPPRSSYDFKDIPTMSTIDGFGEVERTLVAFRNKRQLTIFGSFYRSPEPKEDNPCVIYLHGNASNQFEGRDVVSFFVPLGIHVFCYDSAGCGNSEGQYISLGLYESDDLLDVIKMLETDFHCQKIAVWGRSMGAATVVMTLGNENSKILAAVVDSPFTSVNKLAKELASSFHVCSCCLSCVLRRVQDRVFTLAGFNMDDVAPINYAQDIQAPVFIIHGSEDRFINCNHSQKIFNKISSRKEIRYVAGGHNSQRPMRVLLEAATFLCDALGVPVEFDLSDADEQDKEREGHDDQHFEDVDAMMSKV